MKKMLLYFDRMQDFHLNKDVGLYPHYIAKSYNLELEYLTADSCHIESFKGHPISRIKRFPSFKYNFFFYYYIFRNAVQIDYLMTLHLRPYNLFIGFLYKKLNPRGHFYIKMDQCGLKATTGIKAIILNKLSGLFLKYLDLISTESRELFEQLNNEGWHGYSISDKLTVSVNGVGNALAKTELIPFNKKENLFLTVGRLGTDQKNTEMLLNVLLELDLKDWKFIFAGPVEPNFQNKIDDFFHIRPKLKDTVLFIGNITDRSRLFDYYNRAKVFCMTSRFESYAIVFSEARYFNNYILTTEVGGSSTVTGAGKFGKIVAQDDSLKYKIELEHIINGQIDLESYYNEITIHKDEIILENIVSTNNQIRNLFSGESHN